jgi:mannosyl-oligosaccharide alpha-1,2-mannosidase
MTAQKGLSPLFIMYCIAGDATLQDKAWEMFQAISNQGRTTIAHAALDDITVHHPRRTD